jgi:hypothetical protein
VLVETIARIALFLDLIGITILIVFIWLDLRRQTSDFGKVGSVTVLIALCFVLYFVGRAFFRL